MFTVNPLQKQSVAAKILYPALAVLVLALASVTLHSKPAAAQDALFTSDVNIDVTGENADDARTKAMQEAGRKGLENLMDRLAPDKKAAAMKDLDDSKVGSMVKGLEVLEEKIAGSRYRATLRVSYDALAVNSLLDASAAGATPQAAAPASTSMLVLPILEEKGQRMLWQPLNTWKEAWNRAVLETSGGHVVVPYGDDKDAKIGEADTLRDANYAALEPFFKRYGIGEVVVIQATYTEGANGGLNIVRRHVSPTRNEAFTMEYRPDPQEDKRALMLRAARDIAGQLVYSRNEALNLQAAAASVDGRVMIVVPYTTLNSWTKVRSVLQAMPGITKIEMLAMSSQQVDALLQFRGTKEALARDITAAGLRLIESETYWIISRE